MTERVASRDARLGKARFDRTRHAPLRDRGDGGARRGEGDLRDVDEPVYGPVHGLRSLYARVVCAAGGVDGTGGGDGGWERGTRGKRAGRAGIVLSGCNWTRSIKLR